MIAWLRRLFGRRRSDRRPRSDLAPRSAGGGGRDLVKELERVFGPLDAWYDVMDMKRGDLVAREVAARDRATRYFWGRCVYLREHGRLAFDVFWDMLRDYAEECARRPAAPGSRANPVVVHVDTDLATGGIVHAPASYGT